METKMLVHGEQRTSIWVDNDHRVWIIDQRWLPHEVVFTELTSLDDFYHSIKDMWVRGAPLIGVTAAFGIAKYMEIDNSDSGISQAYTQLMKARPTAVNLRTGLDFVCSKLKQYPKGKRAKLGFEAALKLWHLEISISKQIGRHGGELIKDMYFKKKRPINILTHCNAGWLATVDWGTATAPMYWAAHNNIPIHVFVDETRPRNQGAQLTAWELGENKVSHDLIVDNAGGYLMQIGKVDMVVVGTDRTTADGDVCNKIGTYLKALAAKDNNVPFYVALPSTTIDWTINDGIKDIEIENRSEDEIHFVQGINSKGKIDVVRISPEKTPALNPSFDVTPAKLITGLITEFGNIKATGDSLLSLKNVST